MLVSDFDYDLPEELIAQQPPAVRGTSRMMTLDRRTGAFADHRFADLPSLLRSGDLLVLNDSRVIPARLFATRRGLNTQSNSPAPTGHVEVLLTQRLASQHNEWTSLVKPAIKVQLDETLYFNNASGQRLLMAKVIAAGEFGERTLRFEPVGDFHGQLERIGHLPLPPYIHRDKAEPNTNDDRERYQTVYSQPIAGNAAQGSSAAPTAGLHFTPEVLAKLEQQGVEIARLTLHVGLGTFQPIRVERTEDIKLHAEPYTISEATAKSINRAREAQRRIIAVGTTSTRTLEHIAREAGGEPITAHSGSTSLFLSPAINDEFQLVNGLLTNFHLPQSTLIMLVSALAGREQTLAAYRHAVAAEYSFFSYGDCMLIT
jgi:S-adenosylmethionine:tRNA ribosyltransferase-isomerase